MLMFSRRGSKNWYSHLKARYLVNMRTFHAKTALLRKNVNFSICALSGHPSANPTKHNNFLCLLVSKSPQGAILVI